MRKRSEIEHVDAAAREKQVPSSIQAAYAASLCLEVLLDIRDQLENIRRGKLI